MWLTTGKFKVGLQEIVDDCVRQLDKNGPHGMGRDVFVVEKRDSRFRDRKILREFQPLHLESLIFERFIGRYRVSCAEGFLSDACEIGSLPLLDQVPFNVIFSPVSGRRFTY